MLSRRRLRQVARQSDGGQRRSHLGAVADDLVEMGFLVVRHAVAEHHQLPLAALQAGLQIGRLGRDTGVACKRMPAPQTAHVSGEIKQSVNQSIKMGYQLHQVAIL